VEISWQYIWTTIEYFFKFFFSVIELHERNQPTKLYLGNIDITCFIKVLGNFSPKKRNYHKTLIPFLTMKECSNHLKRSETFSEYQIRFSIAFIVLEIFGFKVTPFFDIFSNFSHNLAKLTPFCSRNAQHGYNVIRANHSEKDLGIQLAKPLWVLKCISSVWGRNGHLRGQKWHLALKKTPKNTKKLYPRF
jgi:hypothetical protein